MRITAGGAITRNGRILLGRRRAGGNYYPDCWDIFGGHGEGGETPDETLKRELQEELGIQPVAFSLIGVYDEPHPDLYGEAKHYFYAVTEWSGEIYNLGNEHDEIHWFTQDDVMNLKLASEKYLELFKSLF